MAFSVLRQLADRYAFDATPWFSDLGAYHVPFESMAGNTSVETRLSECAGRGERIALITESGCGKSSLVSHILGPTAESVAPIIVPVHSLGVDALRAESVADAILLQFERQVREVGRRLGGKTAAIGDRRDLVRRQSRTRGTDIGPKWLRGRAAEQVELQIGSSQPIVLDEKSESIYQVLQAIQTDSLMPVFVFDDTDRWVGPSQSETVVGFFGEAIRWLTDMPTAVVVATHANYLESEEVGQGLLKYLDTPIEIPRVPSREGKLYQWLQLRAV